MDRCLLSNVPHIAELQRMTAQTIETKIDEAIQRMQTAAPDSYDGVSVCSVHWKSGGAEDSSLFIQTLSKLQNVQTCQRSLFDDDMFPILMHEIYRAALQSRSRKLFILHYVGHAIVGSAPDSLIITPEIGQELGSGPEMNMSLIKDALKDMSSKLLGLDFLLVMDSCCAATAGRGGEGQGCKGGACGCYCTQGMDGPSHNTGVKPLPSFWRNLLPVTTSSKI
jgi:hypothetical protein